MSTEVTLRREQACFRDLNWDVQLARAPRSWADLRSALAAGGWSGWPGDSPSLWCIERPDGHQLVVVPRTGRIQLRLHYTSHLEDRAELAERIAQQLARAADRA